MIGRIGSGKTAIFYALRDSFGRSQSPLILDLNRKEQFSEGFVE